MNIKVFLVILGFWLFGCNESDEQGPTPISGLMGSWQGIIKSVSGDSENVIDISLSLDANRTFSLIKTRTREEATGTYDEFPQLRSLTLRVEESEVEELAVAGGIRDFEYELYDGELLLNSRDSLLRLKRPVDGVEDSLNNIWTCTQKDLIWQLSFVGSQFMLYLQNDDGASMFVKGSFSAEVMEDDSDEQRVALFVEDAQPVKVFDRLSGSMFYEDGEVNLIQLIPSEEDGSQLEAMECRVKES